MSVKLRRRHTTHLTSQPRCLSIGSIFSRRFAKDDLEGTIRWKKKEKPEHSGVAEMNRLSTTGEKKKMSDLDCIVENLDGSNATFYLPKRSKGATLVDLAFAFIGLNEEREYFSLRMDDKIKGWVDATKLLKKQCQAGPSYRFFLRAKFFPTDPQQLRDEFARYLFVLQLRQQLEDGSIQCPDDQLAAELAAFLIQGEFGSYDHNQHNPAFISTFHFYPTGRQSETLELAILQEYQKMQRRNLTPAEADRLFLERIRFLPDYGVDMHIVKGKDNESYNLGLTPTGILVYQDGAKIGLFIWTMIVKLEMKGKKLKLVVEDDNEQQRKVIEHTFVFVLPDERTCKHLWKCAIEHHTFFKVAEPVKPPSKIKQFFRLKSRFYTSFRTEHQLHQESDFGSSSFRRRNTSTGQSLRSEWTMKDGSGNDLNQSKTSGDSFRRLSSRRFNARPSFSTERGGQPPPRPLSTNQCVLADVNNSSSKNNNKNRTPRLDGKRVPPRPPIINPLTIGQSQHPNPVVEDHRTRSPLSLPKDYVEYTI